jgi:hypothetical protein
VRRRIRSWSNSFIVCEPTCASTATRLKAARDARVKREEIDGNIPDKFMPKAPIDQILSEINELKSIFLHCRSVFPALGKNMIGQKQFMTAPYYIHHGYLAEIELHAPITEEFLVKHRKIGKWINENAIIRLYGIMKYHGFLDPKIDQEISGWEEVDLMRRIRDTLTKTRLNYKPEKEINVQLREKIIQYFDLPENDFSEGEIPTPIDTVVERIFDGCCKYIQAKGELIN